MTEVAFPMVDRQMRKAEHPPWRRPPVLIGAGVVAAAVVVFALMWFQPQALLFDRVVEDDFPSVDAGAAGEPPIGDEDESPMDDEAMGGDPQEPMPASTEPAAVLAGTFESRSRYTVTGTAAIYELMDGQRVVRLEDFESTNGPDLFVYLTSADSTDDDPALDGDFVDLGALRGNVGAQNYDIPADVDLDHYDTVVIWCRRFTVGFGAADLTPARSGS